MKLAVVLTAVVLLVGCSDERSQRDVIAATCERFDIDGLVVGSSADFHALVAARWETRDDSPLFSAFLAGAAAMIHGDQPVEPADLYEMRDDFHIWCEDPPVP